MSELKAINAYQLTTNTEDCDVYIHNDEFGCGGDLVECYPKSEADKVIAELKEIDSKNRSAYYKDLAMMAKDVEHQKYKRCLAMRNMCRYAQYSYSYLMENESCKIRPNDIDFRRYDKKYHFYLRWRKRWMELAKKFREAK